MDAGRDLWWHDLVGEASPYCEPEWVEAEHPLFLLYTSGSTGKPKGIQHATGGYLLGAKLTSQWVFDLREDDVFWCTADVGWVTGHSYVAYGPLAAGATVVLYEGGPMYPDGGRFWKICQDHGVSIFYTAPTAIRALMKLGDELPAKYDLARLRLLGSVGEPINPEAWMWYHRVIGHERCPIVDTWWQTETGDQTGLVHPTVAWHRCRHRRRSRQARDTPGCGRLPGREKTVAFDATHDLAQQRSLHRRVLGEIQQSVLRGRR
jgi:acetyl-CoA synthetase